MMLTLVRKLLRDVRLPLLILIILMAAFQCLWIKVAQRISGETGLLRQLVWLGEGRGVTPGEIEMSTMATMTSVRFAFTAGMLPKK